MSVIKSAVRVRVIKVNIVCLPITSGIGVGLATSAAFVALNHYFKEKRGQAVGLSMAGTAIGMLILPQLVRLLLEALGFTGAVLVLSCLSLHAAAGSMLLQPVKRHLRDVPIDVELQTVGSDPAEPPPPTTTTLAQPPHAPTPILLLPGGDSTANEFAAAAAAESEADAADGAGEEAELPEMINLLRFNATEMLANGKQQRMRKNFSEVAFSSMNPQQHSGRSTIIVGGVPMLGGGGVGGPRNPRMPRNLSVIALTKAALSGARSGSGGLQPPTAGGVDADPVRALRRRRASVMSHLSTLDFSGSTVLVHMNVSTTYNTRFRREQTAVFIWFQTRFLDFVAF